MAKSKKIFQLVSLFSIACTLTSCDNNSSVVIEEESSKEISLNVSFESATFKYDGLKHSLSIVGELPENVTAYYVGNSQSEVGDYSVSVFFTNTVDSNKKYKSLTATMHIVDDVDDSSLNAALSNILFPDQTVTYTGNAVNLKVLNLPTGYSVTYSTNDDGQGYIDVGTYVVYASISDTTGTKVFNKSAILTILPKSSDLKDIRFDSKTFVYNGVSRSLEIEGTLPSYLSVQYSNNNQVEAGVYTVTATFISSNPNIKAPSPMYATLRIVNELAHTVTFVDSDDKVISTISNVIDGTTLSDESVPNLITDAPTAYEKIYDESLISNIRSDVTVKVTYTLATFNLTYVVPHGKTNSTNVTSYNYNDFFSLSEPDIDKGYYFVGYYEDSSYTKEISAISFHSYGDKVLYAKVEKIPDSGVIFKNFYKLYDGNPANVIPTGNVLDTDKYSISYYDKNGNKLSSAPINAGVYHMVMEYERLFSNSISSEAKYQKLEDFTATLIIDKVKSDTSFNITYNNGVTYDGNVYTRTYSADAGVILNIANLPSYLSYTVEYYDSRNNKLNSYPQDAGSYYARFKFTSDSNHIAPDDIVRNISISQKEITLTESEKKAIFPDSEYYYAKGSTFSLKADLDKLPDEYKNIISVLRYQNEQRTSVGSQTGYVYLTTSDSNYKLNDTVLSATLKVIENENSRNIEYYYKDITGNYSKLTYLDSSNRTVNFTTKASVGDKAPTLTFSESMYDSTLLLENERNFLGKDGFYYGWTKLNWQLCRNNDGTGLITDNVIPTGGSSSTTYYMILSAEKLSITIDYYRNNLVNASIPSSYTTNNPNEVYQLQDGYTVKTGYKLDYLYLDPSNPLGSKVSSIDFSKYRADQVSRILVYPMITPKENDGSYMFRVYFNYKDSLGVVRSITYADQNNCFYVPINGEIPVMGDIEEGGFKFSGWFIQTNENGRDTSDASKRLNNNHILTNVDFANNQNIYIYGELISKNYDVVINFEGEDAFMMSVGYKQKLFDGTTGQAKLTELNERVKQFLLKHPEYDQTYNVVYRDASGSQVDITDTNYVFANTSNMILTASFEKASYYTLFEGVDGLSSYNQLNGGKGVKQIQDSVYSLPTVKDKNGYSFKKWILKAEKGDFTEIDIYSGSIVNLSGIYNEQTHGKLTLVAVYEPNSYLTTFIYDDGINSPVTSSFLYEKSNFYLSDDGKRILTTDDNGRTIIAFEAVERKGYKFIGFYVGYNKLSNLLASLNESIDNDNTLTENEKLTKKRLFKFDYNMAVTCKYEKITYQLRFYDNKNHTITDSTNNYIKELDGYFIVNYDDIFAIPSLASYSGMEGYQIDGFYLTYNTDPDASEDNLFSNRIIDITTCSDSGNFKPSEIVIPTTGRPIVNVYIKLAPKTYNLTLIEDTYTTVDTLHDSIKRTFKTKTVSAKYKEKLADLVVDSYTISDGKGGYVTKNITLLEELPCKDGFVFDGWTVKITYDKDKNEYIKHLVLGYQKDENGEYILDDDGNKVRQLLDEDGNPFVYDYNFDYTFVANYKGNTLNVSYKYEIENALMVNGRYTGGTLVGDISMDDILNDNKKEITGDDKNLIVPGLSSSFNGTIDYDSLAGQYTLVDSWLKNYVQLKNPDNRSLDNVYVASWYYLRYDNYNKDTGEYDSISRIAITSSTTIKSTDKVDLICTLTCPVSPVTFFDTINNTNLAKPSTIHSNVPLKLTMTLEYKRDSATGVLTNEVIKYNYTLTELVDTSTNDYPNYANGSIRSEFSINATDSSSAYTFDGLSFNITYGNEQPEGTPSTISLYKSSTADKTYEFIFQPEYKKDDSGNIIGLSNNFISNPGTVVFSPVYQARNNVRVAFYTSSDMSATTLFSTQYIRAGGTYTIPSEKPRGENGMVFAGWVLRGGDPNSLITSGTFISDSNTSSIIYYAKYEYTNVRITYRVGSEIVMVKQLRDGLSSASQIYDKDKLNTTSIVIGGYEFNGNEAYTYNDTTHQGMVTDGGCVYNHYKINKWKVVDEDGNLVYTKDKYVRSGSIMFLSNLLNESASNVYLEPYEEDEDGKVYVGVALSYNINNVTYGPYVVDENVYFTPLEILKENSLLYQHGLRTVYQSNYATSRQFYSGQQVAIKFNSTRLTTVTFTGVYAYNTNDGTLTIEDNQIADFNPSREKESIWSSVILPGYYFTTNEDNLLVKYNIITGIKDGASDKSIFGNKGSKLIKAVSFPTLENAYTTIGKFAFAYCKNLTTITFNQYTRIINDMAFANCTSLKAFECPNSLTKIGKGAFLNANYLSTVTFNKNLQTIDDGAFLIESFKDVTLSLNLITDLVFPLNLSRIGTLAFAHRSALENISWEELTTANRRNKSFGSAVTIGDYAFAILVDTSIKTGDDKKTISIEKYSIDPNHPGGEGAEYICLDSDFDIKTDVDSTDIRAKAKDSTTVASLSISFPRQLKSIGVGAFKYRKNIKSITFDDPANDFASDVAGSAWQELTIGKNAFRIDPDESQGYDPSSETPDKKVALKAVVGSSIKINFPSNITLIDDYAFAYRYDTITFNNPSTLFKNSRGQNITLKIGNYAFGGFRRMTTTNIDEFKDISNTFKLVLPTRTESIGKYAFYNRYDAKGFYIENHTSSAACLTSIGDYALARLPAKDTTNKYAMANYTFSQYAERNYTSSYTGNLIDTSPSNYIAFLFDKEDRIHYVRSNGDNTPDNSLIDIYSQDIDSYLTYDFENYNLASNLNEVTLPSSLVSIGEGAFQFKTDIKTIRFSNAQERQLTTINSHAFEFCKYLETIENDLCDSSNMDKFTTLGEYAFRGCYNLKGTTTENSLTIPTNVEVIEEGLFADCRKLKNVNLSTSANAIKSIKSYAFYNCTSLETTDNNNNNVSLKYITSISYRAFENCTSLTKVSFSAEFLGSELSDKASSSENGESEPLKTMKIPYLEYYAQNYDYRYIDRYHNYWIPGNSYGVYSLLSSGANDKLNLVGINNYNEVSNQDTPTDTLTINGKEQTLKRNAMDYSDFILDYGITKYSNEFNADNCLELYSKDLDSAYSYSSESDLINGNYNYIYSPLGTRAFYKCSNAEFDFGSDPYTNIYVISNYVFAHAKRTEMSTAFRVLFPYLIDGNQDEAGLTVDDYSNYEEYLTKGDALKGYQGIIGIAPFLDGPIFNLVESSSDEIYLRTKYVSPMGFAGFKINCSNLNLNRIGSETLYNQYVQPMKDTMYNISFSVKHFENEREKIDQAITAENVLRYFDINYVVTPYMFAGSSFTSSTNHYIYIDGRTNKFGFAHMNCTLGSSSQFCFTSKSKASNVSDSHGITFGPSAKRSDSINYIDITQSETTNFKKKPESIKYGDEYVEDRGLSLGLCGKINFATDFIGTRATFSSIDFSGFSQLTFAERYNIISSFSMSSMTILGSTQKTEYKTDADDLWLAYLNGSLVQGQYKTNFDSYEVPIISNNAKKVISVTNKNTNASYIKTKKYDDSTLNYSISRIGFVKNSTINAAGNAFRTTSQAVREWWATYTSLFSLMPFGPGAAQAFADQNRMSHLYFDTDKFSNFDYEKKINYAGGSEVSTKGYNDLLKEQKNKVY